jgi:hypothetical protein
MAASQTIPSAHGHFVQFYKADEPMLNRNVGRFLWDGLLRGHALLVIATAERRESLTSNLVRLGADVAAGLGQRQIALLDAQETLDRFMVDGQPNWELFEAAINDALSSIHSRAEDGAISAYGEMVGVLWQAGQHAAAIRLEEFWNKLLHVGGITLFCGYPIDVFADEFQAEHLEAVRCAHTHLISAGEEDALQTAVNRALDDVLGEEAGEIRLRMAPEDPELEADSGEESILWLWKNLPHAAQGILACARQHYLTGHAALD